VPNAALRFTPTGVDAPGAPNAQQSRGPLSALMPTMPRRFFGGQQRSGGRMGRVWVIEAGKPALAIFKPGATDGRMTQVLPRGQMPNGGGRQGPMANDEKFKKALERKIEPGVKVIVDEEAPKK
jgi:HlyD family secretion protein